MKARRLILIAAVLVGVAALAVWLLAFRWNHSQAFKSLPKLAAAMRHYSDDQVSHGKPLPSPLTVQDLVGGGYISASEVRDLEGADVTFYPTVTEVDPQAVLVRVRMRDGAEIVAQADGSVAQTR
jgi:hypothetical protein